MRKMVAATVTSQLNKKEYHVENTLVVKRVNPVTGYKNLLAFADVTVNGVTINGVRLVQGNNGNFLSMPQRKGKQDKYFPICVIEDPSVREDLLNLLQDELSAGNGPADTIEDQQ